MLDVQPLMPFIFFYTAVDARVSFAPQHWLFDSVYYQSPVLIL